MVVGLAGSESSGRGHTRSAPTQRGRCVKAGGQLLNLRETISELVALKERLTKKKLLIQYDVLLLTEGGVSLLNHLEREGERERK